MTLTKQQIILLSVVVVLIIALSCTVSALLTSHSYVKDESNQFKEVIAAKDSAIVATQRERDMVRAYYDTIIDLKQAQANNYIKKTVSNQPALKANNDKYESIPSIVHNLSRDSLRRAVLEY